jgi:hypothetical protein
VDNLPLRGASTETAPAATAAALDWVGLIADDLPRPAERPFWPLGLDTTPAVRPFAETLVDRGVVYYPNPAPGNQPIGVGHRYSVLVLLPERGPQEAPWVLPLRCERVPTAKKAREVAVEQIVGVLTYPRLPLERELSVEVVDSHYSHTGYLSPVGGYEHHVVIARHPYQPQSWRRNWLGGHGGQRLNPCPDAADIAASRAGPTSTKLP